MAFSIPNVVIILGTPFCSVPDASHGSPVIKAQLLVMIASDNEPCYAVGMGMTGQAAICRDRIIVRLDARREFHCRVMATAVVGDLKRVNVQRFVGTMPASPNRPH